MSSHFYTPDGTVVEGLREARKVNALPSPTTVLGMIASPALKRYFQRQMFEAAATTPRPPAMTDDDYFDACAKAADEHSKSAREKGGDFHDWVQALHLGKLPNPLTGFEKQCSMYEDWFRMNVRDVMMCEQVVIGNGYAGRVDCVANVNGVVTVLDVKTQDLSKRKTPNFYPTWALQLAAYGSAAKLEDAPLLSLVVPSAGEIAIHPYLWPLPSVVYHRIFTSILHLWMLDHDYYPHGSL